MNLSGLKTWITSHKNEVLGGSAVAGVAGFALYKRHQAAAAGSGSSANSSGQLGYSATGTPIAGLTPPDTSATDIQTAVQGQLNDALTAFQNNINQQIAGLTPTASAPAGSGTPQFYYGDAAQGLNYTRDAATGAVYQVGPTGVPYHLSPQQYAELGDPTFTQYGHAPTAPRAPAPAPKPAPRAAAPKARPAPPRPVPRPTYTVQHGDNLFDIARAHGMSLAALEAKNRQIANPSLIYAGQKINL